MVHRYADVLVGFMHKPALYVHVQNQHSKKIDSIFSCVAYFELLMSITDKKKKMERRERGKEMPHP